MKRALPGRLIDPEGEGVYMLADDESWGLGEIAWELFGDARRWRDLNYEMVWMREGGDGHWRIVQWRWWHGLLPVRWAPVRYAYWAPVRYAYLAPKPEAT